MVQTRGARKGLPKRVIFELKSERYEEADHEVMRAGLQDRVIQADSRKYNIPSLR